MGKDNYCLSGSVDPHQSGWFLYEKVFYKLAKDFDVGKTQMSDDCPNIILVSFNATRSGLYANSLGIGWGLDEIFSGQPSSREGKISLRYWLSREKGFTGNELNALISAPKRTGAIILFDNKCQLYPSRLNYNADESNKLTHAEMVMIEEYFRNCPSWYQ